MATNTLYTVYPTAKWYPVGVTGAPIITSSGTQVDSSLVTAILGAATAAGVTVTVDTPPDPAGGDLLTKAEADVLYAPIGSVGGGGSGNAISIQGVDINPATPSAGQALIAGSGIAAGWADIPTPPDNTLSGVTVSTTPPGAGQILQASSAANAAWVNLPAASALAAAGTPVAIANTAPTAGQVLQATDATHASWQTISPGLNGVTVSGTPTSVGQVLTATATGGSGTANWQTPPSSGNSYFAAGLTGDNGATVNNTSTISSLLTTMAANGGGILFVPAQAGDIGITQLSIPDHCTLFGMGVQTMKFGVGTLSQGTAFCVLQGTSYTQGSNIQYLLKLGAQSGLQNLTVKGYCTNNNANPVPVTVWVSNAGCTLMNVSIDAGNGPGLYMDGNSIDSNIHNVDCTAQDKNGTKYYITTCSSASTASGDITFTVASATNLVPGMVPITPGQNITFIQTDTIVTQVSGSTITIHSPGGASGSPANPGLKGNIAGKTIMFVKSPTGLVANSDIQFHGLRSIVGGFINCGADSQFIGCHFSSAWGNHTHNLIHNTSQGATYEGCTFDSAKANDEAHILRVYGQMGITGCRIQCGVTSGNPLAFIQDLGSDTNYGAEITGCSIPNIGSNPLSAVICYSPHLYDTTSGAFVKVNGASGNPNGADQIVGLQISQGAIATYTDALGQVHPVISTQVPSGSPGSTASGTYLPFPGYLAASTYGLGAGAGIQLIRGSTPSAIQHWTPSAAGALTGSTGTPVFAGFGTTCQFVPHIVGTYEWEMDVTYTAASGTSTFELRYGVASTAPTKGQTAGATGTTFSDNDYVTGPATSTVRLRGLIVVTAANAGKLFWIDVVESNSAAASTTITPCCTTLKGPYDAY